jgi:hypothetical protein
VLASHIPLVVLGAKRLGRHPLVAVAVAPLLGLSFLGHKEFRFLMVSIPPAMILCAVALDSFSARRGRRFGIGVLVALALVNLPAAWYTGTVHQVRINGATPQPLLIVCRAA